MTFSEKLQVIERLDNLIRMQATGSSRDLAARLGISKSTIYELLEVMRDMGAEIDYCNTKRSYFYSQNRILAIGFIDPNNVRGRVKGISQKFMEEQI